ncbi:hypothetical protein JXO59_16865, partial [candidate division KSB1 bacterium]|nr:hypothetical protein [candidate division KSB1 bacterium]
AEPHRHICPSMLYWGGPDGFSADRRWEAMAIGPSGLNVRDLGNSYDRGLYEDYFSSIHQIPDGEQPDAISWRAETPHGTSVKFQLRVADNSAKLEKAPWMGPDSADSWYTTSGSKIKNVRGKFIQYRARLQSPNGAGTPYLQGVTIRFARNP